MSSDIRMPYEGNENYVYVSFCKNDSDRVLPVLEKMSREGYRLWYDEQKSPDPAALDSVAQRLNDSSAFIAFVSGESLNSYDCAREINFALMKNKNFVAVFTQEVSLSIGMEMQLAGRTLIKKYEFSDDSDFINALGNTGLFANCVAAVEEKKSAVLDDEDGDEDFEIKRCSVCGAANMANFKFCSRCGNNLGNDDSAAKKQEEERLKAEEEARLKAEEEARLKAEEEARLKAEEEARLKAEEEARLKAEEEARLKAEEEARLKAEEEARLKAEEEARLKAEEEARLKAEEEARLKAEEEARLKAEEEARLKAEEEARLKAEEEARKAAQSVKYICALCDTPAQAGSNFCDKCGGQVISVPVPAPVAEPAPSPAPEVNAKMICSSCSAEVPAGYKFCSKCGGRPVPAAAPAPVPAPAPAVNEKLVCSSCSAEVPAGYKFCSKCGGKPVPAAAPVPAPAVNEKMVCSACSADVPAGYKFCSKCGGKPVPAAASAPAPAVSEKEICSACGAEIPSGYKFCSKCGGKVAEKVTKSDIINFGDKVKSVVDEHSAAPAKPICSKCGAEIPAGYKFCSKCGAGVAPAAAGGYSPEDRTVMAPPTKGYSPTTRYCIERTKNGVLMDIKPGMFVIGRSESLADFVIEDNNTIGRKHAFINLQNDGCYIVDNSSLNKTRLNGKVLDPNVSYRIADGDVILLSDEEFIFREIMR